MTEKELRTKSNEYNAATAVTMGYQEIINSAANYQNIMRAFKEGRAKDLSDEPKKRLEPVFITGSGPSFDDNVQTYVRFFPTMKLVRSGIGLATSTNWCPVSKFTTKQLIEARYRS